MAADLMISEIFGPTIQGEGCKVGRPSIFIRLGGCDQTPPCSWCDTLKSYPKESTKYETLSTFSIIDRVLSLVNYNKHLLATIPIIITGGNPCIQDCLSLISGFKHIDMNLNFSVYVETQGTIFPSNWIYLIDHLVISPKPPSSYNDPHSKGQDIQPILDFFKSKYCIINSTKSKEVKIVIFNLNQDYNYMVNSLFDIYEAIISTHSIPTSSINFTIQIGTLNSSEDSDIVPITNELITKLIEDASSTDEKIANKVRHIFLTNLHILPQVHTILKVR